MPPDSHIVCFKDGHFAGLVTRTYLATEDDPDEDDAYRKGDVIVIISD